MTGTGGQILGLSRSKRDGWQLWDTVVSGMMTVVTNLCQALAPKPGAGSTCSSPIKRAELRGTDMKQLTELKQLRDGGILDQEEYEEQRSDIIKLMRQLSQK